MPNRQTETLNAAARQSLYLFLIRVFPILHPGQQLVEAPYLEAICHELEQVDRGENRRLLIAAPPRHLKSIVVSVAFVAWRLGRRPSERVVVVSYSDDLARVHGQACRAVMSHPMYRAIFPNVAIERATDTDIRTSRKGYRKAISAAGSVTGIGADTLILDDPTKADDVHSPVMRDRGRRLVSETLMSRLNNPRDSRIIFTQQRLHEDDLANHVLENDAYRQLTLPVRATEAQEIPIGADRLWMREAGDFLLPDRFGEAEFQATRRRLGEAAFEAQYQQQPVPMGGGAIDWSRVQFHDQPLEPCRRYHWKIQSWDCAYSIDGGSSYSVCTTWAYCEAQDVWLLVDLWRGRVEFDALVRRAHELIRRWAPAEVYIESAAAGISLLQELRRLRQSHAFGVAPRTSKVERVAANIHLLYDGRAKLPVQASWLDPLSNEMRAFPAGAYDDQVDSITQFLEMQRRERTDAVLNLNPETRRPIGRTRRAEIQRLRERRRRAL